MQPFNATWTFMRDLVRAFNADRVTFLAAAISYFTFFSLFPLMLGLIAIAGYVLAPEAATESVLTFFARGFPAQEAFLRSTLEAVVEARGSIGLIALVMLLWAGKNIFTSLAQAIDIIWEEPPTGSLVFSIKRNLVGLIFAVAVGGAMVAVAALYWLLVAILTFEIPVLGIQPRDIPGIVPLLANLLPVVLVTVSLLAMYRFLPAKPLGFGPSAIGAGVAALLWEILRRLFGWYLATFGHFNEVYGPATSVIVFLLWLYLSAVIFLIGAEVAWLVRLRAEKPPEPEA
ncbi:Inner membrane protein YhjD [compost metagenome]